MNAFTQMGMDAFNEGIASGMPPEAAANAAGDAMGAAATDMGFPADMVADGVASEVWVKPSIYGQKKDRKYGKVNHGL